MHDVISKYYKIIEGSLWKRFLLHKKLIQSFGSE